MAEPVLGIDVGGSAIKAGAVDVATGSLTGELLSVPTPRPATPPALISVFKQLAAAHPGTGARLGVAFPSVIMLTLGTGIGTALFTGGQLFPNTELGHLELRGMDAEKRASAQARTLENLDFPAWAERVNEYLEAMQRLFWPDVFILGGAVSERFAEFAPLLRSPAELRPARFGNQAGVIGAALAASDARP